MARRCCVCHSYKSASYHAFPKDDKLRSTWIQRLRIPESAIKPLSEVCCEHFDASSFVQRRGKKVLKKGATPQAMLIRKYAPIAPKPPVALSPAPNPATSNRICEPTAPSAVYILPANSLQYNIMPLVLKPLASSPLPAVLAPTKPDLQNKNSPSSASIDQSSLSCESPPTLNRNKPTTKAKLRNSVEDFSLTDLKAPETAVRFASLIKEILGEKNHTLRTLRQSNERLERKISFLKSKIKELQRGNSAADPPTLVWFNPMK